MGVAWKRTSCLEIILALPCSQKIWYPEMQNWQTKRLVDSDDTDNDYRYSASPLNVSVIDRGMIKAPGKMLALDRPALKIFKTALPHPENAPSLTIAPPCPEDFAPCPVPPHPTKFFLCPVATCPEAKKRCPVHPWPQVYFWRVGHDNIIDKCSETNQLQGET